VGILYIWLKYYWHFLTINEVNHKRKAHWSYYIYRNTVRLWRKAVSWNMFEKYHSTGWFVNDTSVPIFHYFNYYTVL
jgi:hypothetical protein